MEVLVFSMYFVSVSQQRLSWSTCWLFTHWISFF